MPSLPLIYPGRHSQRVFVTTDTSASLWSTAALWEFRQHRAKFEVVVCGASIMLCDDKPASYGAPDVLTVSADTLMASYSLDRR